MGWGGPISRCWTLSGVMEVAMVLSPGVVNWHMYEAA